MNLFFLILLVLAAGIILLTPSKNQRRLQKAQETENLLTRGESALLRHDNREAIGCYEQAVLLAEEGGFAMAKAEANFGLARAYANLGNRHDAAEFVRRSLSERAIWEAHFPHLARAYENKLQELEDDINS